MFTRQIGKLLRGSATPFQILAAAVIGSCLAFIPGFKQAPGLLLAWLAVLVILNANLFLAGVIGVAAKLVALLIAPVSFALGRWLIEGPARGLCETLVNAPVFAWFGFEYPLVVGGQVAGALFGVVAGVLVIRLTHATWRKLAALEQDSAAFKEWMAKRWVRWTSFIFVGGLKGKESYEHLLAKRIGNPVRVLGLVLVALVAALGYVGAKFFDDAIITSLVRSGLETANGATVDLERASFDPAAGSLTLTNLALCDPDALETNLFAAKSVAAKLSASDLLRKRATIDLVTITDGRHGEARKVKGERFTPPPETDTSWKLPDMQSLGDILKNADVWQERLANVRRWLEKFSSSDETPPIAEAGRSYEDILRERIAREGYANYFDAGLVQQAPTLLIRRIEAAEVRSTVLPGELLTITAENVSTQPQLVPEAPRLAVRAASGVLAASVAIDPRQVGGTLGQLEFLWKGLSVDELAAQLKSGDNAPPVRGGTIDIATSGVLSLVDSKLPVTLTLRNTTLALAGSAATPVAELPFPVEVRGPVDRLSVKIDPSAVKKALGNVVKGELQRRLTGELDKLTGGDGTKAEGGSVEDTAKSLLDGFLNKKPKDAEKKDTPAPAPTP